ncbi:C-type lectin domain family 14 member A [Phyllopteryx taeniolatus]|uniref:C-type lectin domain family 14 member A n=1 Tax=Phyllopteryx taeniolatus TaxID=161469 RepID=UPI002AD4D5C1|nr:C-type lectin domain family 14 member A [Phyllopteryx taeniolatus]
MFPPPRHRCLHLLLAFTLTLTSAAPASGPRYMPHHTAAPFEQAQEACRPHGLASFATARDLARVLGVIAESPSGVPPAGSPAFWVGLKKAKNQCVVPSLPLRGFKWTRGGEEATETFWAQEPEQTCTSVLCAGLVAKLDGSTVTSWGLVPLSCKTRNHFICNLESEDGGPAGPESAEPELLGPKPAEPKFAGPEPTQPEPTGFEPAGPQPAGAQPAGAQPAGTQPAGTQPAGTQPVEPESAEPEPEGPELSEQKPELPVPPTLEPAGPESARPEPAEPELREPAEQDPDVGRESVSDSCPHPVVAGARFLSLDPDNSSRIQVDCWSKVRLDLHCRSGAGGWRLPGGAPANLSSVCTPCGTGYRKDASGDCADVDECSGAHGCPHSCVNTAGSFACVCVADPAGAEDGAACEPTDNRTPGPFSGALVPALVGVAVALVVLLVVALVTLKCCLRRRSKKKEEVEQRPT